jgi:hypothetical protein
MPLQMIQETTIFFRFQGTATKECQTVFDDSQPKGVELVFNTLSNHGFRQTNCLIYKTGCEFGSNGQAQCGSPHRLGQRRHRGCENDRMPKVTTIRATTQSLANLEDIKELATTTGESPNKKAKISDPSRIGQLGLSTVVPT